MEIQFNEIENHIKVIKLIGILDANGVRVIETKFTSHAIGDQIKLLVDLANVEFLTSSGIGLLVTAAKSIVSRGGKMVLLKPNDNVHGIFEMTGIMDIIPICMDLQEAIAALNA